MSVKIAPSILAADFSRLGEEVQAVDAAGCDWIHIDVMDGHFVPNLTIGPAVVKALRPCCDKDFDVHLMIEEADSFIGPFVEAGADSLTIHVEAGRHIDRTLENIRALGKKAGVALNPATPLQAVEYLLDKVDLIVVMTVNPGFSHQSFIPEQLAKITRLRDMIGDRPIALEADGGIGPENIASVIEAGADVIVAGAAIFANRNPAASLAALRKTIACGKP